ncbi:MAG: cycloisomerase [Acidisphaera sp.]|nr:cycloisomerase [Acidisphaera sp.]
MRITDMRVQVVRLPVRAVHSHGIGDMGGSTASVILRLDTDAGITGWGEAAPWVVFTGSAEANAAALDVYLRPLLLGADPFRIEALLARAERAVVHCTEAKAAMEMALFDIVGKALGAPVCTLLGGCFRDEIPLSFSVADPDFSSDLDLVAELCRQGVRLFKVKTGFAGHPADLHRLTTLRAQLPDDAELRVDYNQGMEAHDAIRRLRDVETVRPTFIEQPVPRHQLAALAAITAALDTPIMADESVFSPAEALHVAANRIADLISVKIMKSGGMLRAREVAAIAGAAGLACYGGSMFETGIASTAGAHLIAATPNISLGCEFYQPSYYLTDDLLAAPFPVRDGKVQVPTGPGLGIEVDEDKLARYAV